MKILLLSLALLLTGCADRDAELGLLYHSIDDKQDHITMKSEFIPAVSGFATLRRNMSMGEPKMERFEYYGYQIDLTKKVGKYSMITFQVVERCIPCNAHYWPKGSRIEFPLAP